MNQRIMPRTTRSLIIAACLASSPQIACAQAPDPEHDFRALGASPEVHVCESESLLDLLELTDEQRERLGQRLDAWKAGYLERKKEIDALPEDDVRGRRGWPPNRDRELNAELLELLDDEQQKRFNWIMKLWNYGPVRFPDAHNTFYQSELQLTADQYRRLHALQVRWIQEAYPFVTAPGQPPLDERYLAIVVIGTAGWKFKAERDAAWSAILTEQQARRWRQIELQQYLLPQGVRFLVTGRDPPRTSSSYANWVPYFEVPAESLNLSDEQKSRLLEICEEYEDSPNPYSQPGVDREERLAALREKQKERLRQIEDVFTEEQHLRWRELLGEPTVFTRWITE